jgi:hypothetical protein
MKFLLPKFLEAMNEIGRYGHGKYGTASFQHRASVGDYSRGASPRTTQNALANHAQWHFEDYLNGRVHDHFGTRRHQLAAVAYNAMMEFYFAGLEKEK